MRILFAVSPWPGHLFPIVPTAWALRAAGHDILVATTGVTGQAVRAGLHAYDVAPGVDLDAVRAAAIAELASTTNYGRAADPLLGAQFAGRLFAAISDAMTDGTVSLAEQWRPDLVVHTTLQGCGPLVAAKCGVPAVEHGVILSAGSDMTESLRAGMAGAYARHGVTGEPPRIECLDVTPPSMSRGERGIAMRYVPYNAGGILPDWLLSEPELPRIAVTWGSVPHQIGGLGQLSGLIDAARDVDAEFVLALGDADPAVLGALQDNVRAVGWVPLNALLPTCAALVHHGGSGTTFTALAMGTPQLVLPQGSDQFYNAQTVAARHAGLMAEADKVDGDLVRQLLSDTAIQAAAGAVAAEIAGRPAPLELVPSIVALAC